MTRHNDSDTHNLSYVHRQASSLLDLTRKPIFSHFACVLPCRRATTALLRFIDQRPSNIDNTIEDRVIDSRHRCTFTYAPSLDLDASSSLAPIEKRKEKERGKTHMHHMKRKRRDQCRADQHKSIDWHRTLVSRVELRGPRYNRDEILAERLSDRDDL